MVLVVATRRVQHHPQSKEESYMSLDYFMSYMYEPKNTSDFELNISKLP